MGAHFLPVFPVSRTEQPLTIQERVGIFMPHGKHCEAEKTETEDSMYRGQESKSETRSKTGCVNRSKKMMRERKQEKKATDKANESKGERKESEKTRDAQKERERESLSNR